CTSSPPWQFGDGVARDEGRTRCVEFAWRRPRGGGRVRQTLEEVLHGRGALLHGGELPLGERDLQSQALEVGVRLQELGPGRVLRQVEVAAGAGEGGGGEGGESGRGEA